jgi:uncharacterized membrane protein YphA (DoxX/SURF4 family)
LRLLGGVMTTTTKTNAVAPVLCWLCLLLLCAAYLQGGLVKLFDFPAAVGEMTHFGLQPAALFAVAVIALELGAVALILMGRLRWLGALALAIFTAAATFMANRYWEATGPDRFMLMNAFFEHWGLVGGFLLVAAHDWQDRRG